MHDSCDQALHGKFVSSTKRHVLMITNHGIHQWNVIPGLPDTGGQNVFVNQLSDTLEKHGFRITIVNRGGYAHPTTGELHTGMRYRNESCRIVYIEDSLKAFVRKEDMNDQLPELVESLCRFLVDEGIPISMMVSHYWDGAKLGVMLNDRLAHRIPHIWVPHSLGSIKKRNVRPERWRGLRIDERIRQEREIVRTVDMIADTSVTVRNALVEDYDARSGLFLPPCVKTSRFHPEEVTEDNEIWEFLSGISGLPAEDIRRCKIITEISRTDTTKRKDVLIEAFSRAHRDHPDTFLIVAIDDNEKELSVELKEMLRTRGIERHTAPIGNEWDRMPTIYNISDIYCSPSIMEGFGMSIQEAASVGIPGIGSSLIPFVSEYLLGDDRKKVSYRDDSGKPRSLEQGAGAIMVCPDDVAGFTLALNQLLDDEELREEMGRNAYKITIPYFTWHTMVKIFLDTVGTVITLDDGQQPTTNVTAIPMAG